MYTAYMVSICLRRSGLSEDGSSDQEVVVYA
jgi:hypothetical protein